MKTPERVQRLKKQLAQNIIELNKTKAYLNSISPKVSIYTALQEKKRKLERDIAFLNMKKDLRPRLVK